MIRYSVSGKTVKELLERFQNLVEQGCGDDIVLIFDPDSEEWEPVTGFDYGGVQKEVRLYSDEP